MTIREEKMKTVLILRTCTASLTSQGGFQWPTSGHVAAPDWKPTQACGHGLHGLLWGCGDASLLDWSEQAKWLVVEVTEASIIDLGDKVKFPEGTVVYCGDRNGAANLIAADPRAAGKPIIAATVTAGFRGTATAGFHGTATAGDYGSAIAGNYGTATAGYGGTAMAGDYGTATAGIDGTATAGESGTATAGIRGTATAGDYGMARAGYGGTATAGDYGTATAGIDGTATAGVDGTILIRYWAGTRFASMVGLVGENGIEADRPYGVQCRDGNSRFIAVEEQI